MVATRDSDHQQTFTVTHRGNYYNIRNFLQKYHPGGFKWVKPYEGKDITKSMEKYHHSKNAYYILREYKKGGRDSSKNDSDEDLEVSVAFGNIVGQAWFLEHGGLEQTHGESSGCSWN